MSKHSQKMIRPLAGHFLGWGDERVPHRQIKLAMANGELTVKVAKSLRSQIQDWQPGIWLTLMAQERVTASGETKFKVKQLLTSLDAGNVKKLSTSWQSLEISHSDATALTQIRVCQGASCRRRGSEGICQAIQAYLDDRDLNERVEIKSVKCVDRCKSAPNAIVISPEEGCLPGKTHYHKLQPSQITPILDKHFSTFRAVTPLDDRSIEHLHN